MWSRRCRLWATGRQRCAWISTWNWRAELCANLVGLEPDDLSPQDIRDAAGELANMTGGSVKALCSPTSRLSLPSVAMGHDFEFTVAQGTVILQASFSHPCGALTVSVIEKQSGERN